MVVLLSLVAGGSDALAATEIGASRPFGLGLQLGGPAGITGKVYLGGRVNALDFTLGTYYNDGYSDNFYGQVSYHAHLAELTSGSGVAIPFRIGIGGFLGTGYWVWDSNGYDAVLGARVPFGLDFDLESVPLQFYVELAFQLAVIPFVGVGGDGGIGFRYYF